MKNNNTQKIILVLVIALSLLIYFKVPMVNEFINMSFNTLKSMDVEKVKEVIRSYGIYAAAISFILMVLQSLVAPIPAFLLTFANASIFGWVKGAILSWSSAMVGAILCFYIARIAGRDVVERLTSKTALKSVDYFFEKYGKHTILICRLLPFISFDIVSYAAGLTKISLVGFIIATGIGQLPATLIYSYVGDMLTGNVKTIVTGLLVLSSLFILIYVIKNAYEAKNKIKINKDEIKINE